MWSVKNWNGAVSPYSSPMNSIGTYGDSSVQKAASGWTSAGRRSPKARLPTWSWFWSKTTNCSTRRSAAGAPKRRRRNVE